MVACMNTKLVLVLAVLAAAVQVQADDLRDPTRPPAAMLAPAAAASAPADAPQLQSVLLGNGRKPAAVISGQLVLLGGQLGDARLVRVTERSAVLKGPQGETTLALTPPAPETTR
jgi:MSHA biogenesis protein MshK